MEREHVQSEALCSIGYDFDTQVLEIEFVGGTLYRYFEVPDYLYLGLMEAGSRGEYFARHIRNAGFDFEQVR